MVRSLQGKVGFSVRPRRFRNWLVAGPLLAAGLLLGGCISSIVISTAQFKGMVAYAPTRSTNQIDAGNARIFISVTHALAPEVHNTWTSWGNGETSISNYQTAVAEVVADDLTKSDLFINANVQVRVQSDNGADVSQERTTLMGAMAPASAPAVPDRPAPGEGNADVEIIVRTEESHPKDFQLTVSMKVVDVASQTVINTYTQQADLGDSGFKMVDRLKAALQTTLNQMKANLAADFSGGKLMELAVKAARLDPADLNSLLVAKDRTMTIARARNRALVAANTLTLPGLLQRRKTAELVDLTVKMEQVILDLEHEAELAMGSAQGEAGEGNSAQRYREWALVYKERISILRPMLSAIKEEIANRGK